jgi:hypothetical protein
VTKFVVTGYLPPYGQPVGYDSTATLTETVAYQGGLTASVTHPVSWNTQTGQYEYPAAYTYEMDALGRPVRMKQNGALVFGDVGYGAGGEMTQFGTEARQYNVLGQLTRITKPGAMDMRILAIPITVFLGNRSVISFLPISHRSALTLVPRLGGQRSESSTGRCVRSAAEA